MSDQADTGSVDTGVNEGTEQAEETTQGEAKPVEPQPGETKAEAQRRYLSDTDDDAYLKLKIEGEEQEFSVKELKKLTSLEKASRQRMQQAATLQKQVSQFIDMARQDPRVFFKETGIDPYEFAESTLAEKYELMQLTPEQRRLMEVENELKTFKEAEARKVQEDTQARLSADEAKEMQSLETEMMQAWEEVKLPKHKHFGSWMAATMLSHQKRTGEPLQAKDAAVKVKQDFIGAVKEIVQSLDAEAIQELLGKDVLKRVREHEIKRVTDKASAKFQQPQSSGPAKAASKKPVFKTDAEYRDYMQKLASTLTDN